jgi:NlpC/P60 family putative phage cell wall peptidase
MATDPAVVIAAARGWIGTPYLHQASLKGVGCDCLGLLRGIWRELRGEEPEVLPHYSADWAEATGEETLSDALARHLTPIPSGVIVPGSVLVFRMTRHCPAKHCGVLAEQGGRVTLIHARQNKRVSEEAFTAAWRRKLAFAFEVP